MKKIIYFILPVLLFAAVFLSCDTTEPEKPVDYTYSIEKVFWTDSVDNNGDGYTTNRILWVHVKLEENVTRNVYADIYYKPSIVANYSYFGSSPEMEFAGINSPLTIQVAVGPPQGELMFNSYDFKVEVYEVDSDRMEASLTKEDEGGEVLGDQTFEALATDQIYTLNLWWQNEVDENLNGIPRIRELMIDVNLDQDVSKKITTEVYQKEKGAEDYSLYFRSDEYEIKSDNIDDTVKVTIGDIPKELKGEYDFKIAVYEEQFWFPVAYLDIESDDPLADSIKGIKFEAQLDDKYFYSIVPSSLAWQNEVDLDKNGFVSQKSLSIDVNVDKEESRFVWARVFYRHQDSTRSLQYRNYFRLAPKKITGSDPNDKFTLEIGTVKDSTKLLYNASYDFMINIYEYLDSAVITSIGSDTSAVLRMQKFETATEDSTK